MSRKTNQIVSISLQTDGLKSTGIDRSTNIKTIHRILFSLCLIAVVSIGFVVWNFFQNLPLTPLIGGGAPLAYTPLPPVRATPTTFFSLQPEAAETVSQPPNSLIDKQPLPPIQPGSQLYFHPLKTFQFYPPAGWTHELEGDSVVFYAPDKLNYLVVRTNFTGDVLDANSFEGFVLAREANLYGQFLGNGQYYQDVERAINPASGLATVTKKLIIDHVSQAVVTSYLQDGQAIYTIDYWKPLANPEDKANLYVNSLDNLVVSKSSPNQTSAYPWTYTFHERNNAYTVEVPDSWTYEPRFETNTTLDTFYSPDRHAVFTGIVFNDGNPISKQVAGQFTLTLLRNYIAQDIHVTDDRIMANGGEKLIWNSLNGKYHGDTRFIVQDQSLLIYSIVVDDAYDDVYMPVLERILDSFTVVSQ